MEEAQPSEAQRKHFETQLARDGAGSLQKSSSTLARRMQDHRDRLDQYRSAGGYTSYIEAEIRNFEAQIAAIDEILRAKS